MHNQGLPAARLLRARLTSTVRNVKIARFEKIILLLNRHVDVPYSLVVTSLGGELFLRDGKNAAFV